MPSKRTSLAIIFLLGYFGLLAVFVPIPSIPANTYAGCEHDLPSSAIFGCDVVMEGYGSATYDLVGYGGFLGPTGHYDVYSLWF